jgi:nucleoside-diphosphate-sugar epimerase
MVLSTDVVNFTLIAAEIGGIYNLTDGINPSFKELSKCVSNKIGKSFVPNLPIFFAIFLAKIGDILGNNFPINSNKLSKIISTLTFDDSKARIYFGWDPKPVLEFIDI